MSTAALATVSTALRDFLQGALGSPVVLADPAKAKAGDVSLWLYQVGVDEFTRNRPAAQAEAAANGRRQVRLQLPPLGVNLFYLVAPIFDDQEMAQNKLAAVLLALHESPHLTVEAAGAEVSETVRISLVPDTLDDRIKLWESLSQPYRLSICYQARTVRLLSKRLASSAPVVSVTAGLEEQPAARAVE